MKRETILISAVGAIALLSIVAFLVLSPAGGDFGRREVDGPPEVRSEVAAAHARQFDDELAEREGGSQEEQAAATYLLGVFQTNGYVVRLEAVPVGDLVSSTDLIATPPGVDEPSVLVVVPYGSSPDAPPTGRALGMTLEVARALNVADPDHTIGFVAAGAEYSDREGGALGSRRLAQLLVEADESPVIVQIVEVSERAALAFEGPDATSIFGPGDDLSVEPDVFATAGFDRYLIAGPPEELGEVLLQGLQKLQQ